MKPPNKPIITLMPISKARIRLGELTNKVFRKENVYILSKSGLPIAAIIDMEDFDKLGLSRLDKLNSLVRGLDREAEEKEIDEHKLEEMMEETEDQVYKKTYGK